MSRTIRCFLTSLTVWTLLTITSGCINLHSENLPALAANHALQYATRFAEPGSRAPRADLPLLDVGPFSLSTSYRVRRPHPETSVPRTESSDSLRVRPSFRITRDLLYFELSLRF